MVVINWKRAVSWSVIQHWTCSLSTKGKMMVISVLLIKQRRDYGCTGDVHNLSNHMEHPHNFSTITLLFRRRQNSFSDWPVRPFGDFVHILSIQRKNMKVGTISSVRNRLRTHGSLIWWWTRRIIRTQKNLFARSFNTTTLM